MSDNVVANVAVALMCAGAAWSEWVSYRRSRTWAEVEDKHHRRQHERPEADR